LLPKDVITAKGAVDIAKIFGVNQQCEELHDLPQKRMTDR
jgi:hypothetical protein